MEARFSDKGQSIAEAVPIVMVLPGWPDFRNVRETLKLVVTATKLLVARSSRVGERPRIRRGAPIGETDLDTDGKASGRAGCNFTQLLSGADTRVARSGRDDRCLLGGLIPCEESFCSDARFCDKCDVTRPCWRRCLGPQVRNSRPVALPPLSFHPRNAEKELIHDH